MPTCRYSNKPLMIDLFKAVAKHWREAHFGKEDCAKWFVERGGGVVLSGVEGGYTPDGVMICHMFMMRQESPTDTGVLMLGQLVSGSFRQGERLGNYHTSRIDGALILGTRKHRATFHFAARMNGRRARKPGLFCANPKNR